MKIAFIYDALYPEVKGGVERRLYEIGRRLAKKHEVHWYSFNWWSSKERVEREGIILQGVGKPLRLYREGKRDPWEALTFSSQLLMKEFDAFDIVDCQEFPYLPAYSLKLKFPTSTNLVITWHEYWGDYWKEYLPLGSNIGKLIERGMLKLTDNHIVVSRHTLQKLLGIGRKRYELIPNGIDFRTIQRIPEHPDKRYDAVFVGRLIGHKNLKLLLMALRLILREIPSFKVAIIGDGPMRDELKLTARKLGIERSVDFLGFVPTFEEVVSILKSSRVFAFPSLREGFGMTVLEANAAGIPAVVVDAPMNASTELITPGKNGYVSDPTPEDFARKLLLAREYSHRMRRSSISYARKYDWDNVTNQIEQYYRGVADGA